MGMSQINWGREVSKIQKNALATPVKGEMTRAYVGFTKFDLRFTLACFGKKS